MSCKYIMNGEYNHEWSDEKENRVKTWRNTCMQYICLYEKKIEKWQTLVEYINNAYLAVSISIMALSLTITLAADELWYKIVISVFGALNAGISGYKKNTNPEEKLASYIAAYKTCRDIVFQIDQQLDLSREQRTNGRVFLFEILKQMAELEGNITHVNIGTEPADPDVEHAPSLNLTRDESFQQLTPDQKHRFEIFVNSAPAPSLSDDEWEKFQKGRLR